MSSKKISFQINDYDYQYARLLNWQKHIEEKIRTKEIETGRTWDGQPISDEQIDMLKNGTAKVHWGYCTKPYSYTFSPEHPNASQFSEEQQYLYGEFVYIRVINNVTGDTLNLSETSSEFDNESRYEWAKSISTTKLIVPKLLKTLRWLRLVFWGLPKTREPIELGGIPAGSDLY